MIRNNILYATVIENDGRVGKQFTFLGSVLGLAAASTVVTILFLAVGWASALLK
jgi:hypothetical protein